MKELRTRFADITERNQFLSSYACFARAVRGQNYARNHVSRMFSELVDKEDYLASDGQTLRMQLWELSNTPPPLHFQR